MLLDNACGIFLLILINLVFFFPPLFNFKKNAGKKIKLKLYEN